MPWPVSANSTTTSPEALSKRVLMLSSPPSGIASRAFKRRLRKTCCIWSASAEVEHVAQDLRDARDLRGGEPEHLARLRLVLAARRARLKYLDERRDGGERVVHFVRDARGERARRGELLRADEVFVQGAQALDVVGHLAAHLVEGGGEESDLVVTSEFDAGAVGPARNVNGGLGQASKRARDDAYDERDEYEVGDERGDDAEDEVALPSLRRVVGETPPDNRNLEEREAEDGNRGD